MKLKIREEYEDLCPQLDADDYDALKQSIKDNGIRTKLHVLDDGTILCGHTRFRIAQELGITDIPYEIVKIQGKDKMILYVIEDNLIRRQLTTVQKCKLGEVLEPIYARINKEKQVEGGKNKVSTESVPTKTTKDVAKDIGVHRETYERFKKIRKENPDAITKIEKGESSINKEYKALTQERKIPNMPFRKTHIPMILNGTKTQTSRGRNMWEQGDTVNVVLYEPNIAKVNITKITKKKLSEFTEADAKREGGYTLEQFKKVWLSIHGNWNENSVVTCIQFEEVKK